MLWPALDVDAVSDPDSILATVEEYSPTAAEERGDTLRVYFANRQDRDRAALALAATSESTRAIDVDDEDWARRSQAQLGPVRVGRIQVSPPWASLPIGPPASAADLISIIIEPSMGFGTGHHATTRLCLAALQSIDLTNRTVLDVGTGSGILAIAAARLGAAQATGLDLDPDAIRAATDNLALNPATPGVRFVVTDLAATPLPAADIVVANLTGSLLERVAPSILEAARPGGSLILSGILEEEADSVRRAFQSAAIEREAREDEWVCLTLNRAAVSGV